jgi:DNA end-binding protein Ku
VLQTLLWADEVRAPEFEFLSEETHATDKELAMASSLVDALSGDYVPEEFEDDYAEAVEALVSSKIEGGVVKEAPAAKGEETEVIDLLAALQRSVDRAKAAKRGETTDEGEEVEEAATGTEPAAPTTRTTTKRASAKAPAKKAATKTATKSTSKSAAPKAAAPKAAAKTAKKAASKTATKKSASAKSKAS